MFILLIRGFFLSFTIFIATSKSSFTTSRCLCFHRALNDGNGLQVGKQLERDWWIKLANLRRVACYIPISRLNYVEFDPTSDWQSVLFSVLIALWSINIVSIGAFYLNLSNSTQSAAGLKAFWSLLSMGATSCANHDPIISIYYTEVYLSSCQQSASCVFSCFRNPPWHGLLQDL